jgi:hypothetical protein
VRIDLILYTVLHEARKRQSEEVMETLAKDRRGVLQVGSYTFPATCFPLSAKRIRSRTLGFTRMRVLRLPSLGAEDHNACRLCSFNQEAGAHEMPETS